MSTIGFNLIGYVSGNAGLGVAARGVASLLIGSGCPVAIYDLDAGFGRSNHDNEFQEYFVEGPGDLPYEINFFICNPVSLGELLAWRNFPITEPDRLNVGMIFWELPAFSKASANALQFLDVIVSASDFIRYIVELNVSGVRTVGAFYPVMVPQNVASSRDRFELPRDKIIFISSFDPYSDTERKNPGAAITAFEAACADTEDCYLVIKLNNASHKAVRHPDVEDLIERCRANPRIRLIAETLTYAETIELYASCDVFVSLHRAEGLGLGLMEAMSLGKPVIATAWSGNLSFMNYENSCLVGYDLVEAKGTALAYKKDRIGVKTKWADANVEEAAAWITKLTKEPEVRAAIGLKASQAMARYQEQAQKADFVRELAAIKASIKPKSVAEKSRELAMLREAVELDHAKFVRGKSIVWRRTNNSLKRAWNRHVTWRFQ